MPRHPRLFVPGATYHVYCRVARGEFVLDDPFEYFSGHTIVDLASRSRSRRVIRGRVEFATLAVVRYGLKCRDVAALLNKHGNSVTNWLNQGLHLAGTDPDFIQRLDRLDAAISGAT